MPDNNSSRRIAFIIASDFYKDNKLAQLKAPSLDAQKLEKILRDESVGGGYDVKIFYNQNAYTIKYELEKLFKKAGKDDKILIYFAGHGHKSIDDSLPIIQFPKIIDN